MGDLVLQVPDLFGAAGQRATHPFRHLWGTWGWSEGGLGKLLELSQGQPVCTDQLPSCGQEMSSSVGVKLGQDARESGSGTKLQTGGK